jgi:hypothetical protein
MAWSDEDDARVRAFCKTVDVGKLTQCPKCGMGAGGRSEMMLSAFCTHSYCPFREWKNQKDASERASNHYYVALDAWKKDGGARPAKRPDGIPTRADLQWRTPAELAITQAMEAVKRVGASLALTDAVMLLSKAMDRVADHVEGNGQ